jgi:hypothetical protein
MCVCVAESFLYSEMISGAMVASGEILSITLSYFRQNRQREMN